MIEPALLLKIEAMYKMAEESGVETKPSRPRRSSLHQIIRTKEQADRFMKLLRLAQEEAADHRANGG